MNYTEVTPLKKGETPSMMDTDKANQVITALNDIIRFLNQNEKWFKDGGARTNTRSQIKDLSNEVDDLTNTVSNITNGGSNVSTVTLTFCNAGSPETREFVILT